MCLKFSILVANFPASIFENVYVKFCWAEKFDVVLCDFVLLLEVFNVVCWSDVGGLCPLNIQVLLGDPENYGRN